jgi:hypothetical protein
MTTPALSALTSGRVPLFTLQYPRPTVWIKATRLRLIVPSQEGNNWCWAAVAVGVEAAYEGMAECQCAVAARVVGTECCPYGKQTGCDTTQDLPCALGPHTNGLGSRDPSWKTDQFVKEQIVAGAPIAVRIEWSDNGGGHFVVISGYIRVNGNFDVYVCDPEDGSRTPWRLSQFIRTYKGNGSWDISFKTKGTKPVPHE